MEAGIMSNSEQFCEHECEENGTNELNFDEHNKKLKEQFCEHKCEENGTNILDFDEHNTKLEERINSLKDVMEGLKNELARQRDLWKKDVEEAEKLSKNIEQMCTCSIPCSCEEESKTSTRVCEGEPTLNDVTILEYEKKLAMYQETLAKAHAEKRMHLRRHLAANAYKKRLLEVENMCNLELLKVKQSVQFLQPLQAIASEWNYELKENTANLDDEISGGTKLKNDLQLKKDNSFTMENLSSKINSEIKEMTSHTSPTHSSFGTTSSLLQEDDEDTLMIRRLQSMGWYNNEINQQNCNHFV